MLKALCGEMRLQIFPEVIRERKAAEIDFFAVGGSVVVAEMCEECSIEIGQPAFLISPANDTKSEAEV